jgi:hypothetical protein
MDSIWTNLKNGTTPIGSSAGERLVPVNAQARFVCPPDSFLVMDLNEPIE